ncbi:uncharacterized protein LOC131036188 isoform X2 [Cryptomeria japonica]|uniref:uncharacterized protein LOC131036188 isoform X2 n=1 Tax=Cryptomeria japonica TaxID=3369 RepID=UPI0027DA09CA|nr:uncharacterized protein LOC131036188 isoform X2 [Cryptomeria japonica]
MAEFTQDILEFLQRNHFTDALAALQSELADQKSSYGHGFLNDSTCLSPQMNRRGSNENHGREQRTKLRDDGSMDIKSFKPNNLTAYTTSEKGISRTLKDEYDSEAENSGFPCSSSKALSNKQMGSEFRARELECDSSNHESYRELGVANSEGTLYENEQIPISVNGYADGALEQYKTSHEQRQLQDSAGTSEEKLMLYKGHVQFGNSIDYSFPGDPKLGLSGISIEKTRIVKELGNNMIEAKGNFDETQDEEILKQDIPEVQYSPRKIHSREDLWDQIGTISQPDDKNHALKEVDLDLRLHGRDYNFSRHDKKTSGPQIGNDMLDLEPNIKSHGKFDQGNGMFVQENVLAHEIAEECFAEETGYRKNIGPLKEVPLKTAFPFSLNEVFVNNEQLLQSQALGEVAWAGNDGIVQGERRGLMRTDTGHGREGPSTQMLNYQGSLKQKKVESLNLLANMGSSTELFPSFSSKMFQVADYSNNDPKEKFDRGRRMDSIASGTKPADMESSVLLGSYIHIPLEQEIRNSGKKLTVGSRQPSNYQTAQGDSGIFDNDKDLGYIRQPIKNDSWLFNNEIYYATKNEEWRSRDRKASNEKKNEHDNKIFSEKLYFPAEQHFQSNNELKVQSENTSGSPMTYNYDGKLISNQEKNSLQTDPDWQGLAQQRSGVEILKDGDNVQRSKASDFYFVDHHELMRSTGVGSCGYEDTDTNVRRNCIVASTEGLSLYDKPVKYDRSSNSDNSIDRAQEVRKRQEVVDHQVVRYDCDSEKHHRTVHDSKSGESDTEEHFINDTVKERPDGLDSQNPYSRSLDITGFSFPSSSSVSDVSEFKEEPEKSFLSNNTNMVFFNGEKYSSHNMASASDIQIASGRKSENSLSVWSARDGKVVDEFHTMQSINYTHFNYEEVERMGIKRKEGESLINRMKKDEDTERVEDEEAASLGQLILQTKAQQDQFETFDLQIVHRRNRTGYEDVKDYHAILNTVIAGRYHEHLFIVCELLKANLYEFYKFNRESGGEAYFTMPRLQSIAIQCLEALQFLHNLGLIHCDLKPENILMKSYSRCEVKVIDLGSSCFDTDYLSSNVQSRSYRAPEVILGLPYDNRIDIWSLGCILPELFLGNVLFQSDSLATLLASMIAVVGPIDEEMLVMGGETHKYFTKSYTLYERNQDTNGIEFLTPKRTSLQNILHMADQGFIDFVTYLLEINPKKRPTASAALQHPWLSYTYDPISS